MYCQKCGIRHPDDVKQCQICGIALTGQEQSENIKIFTDLTRYPFQAILNSLKNANLILALIAAPFITLIYFWKKITRTPFLSALLNTKTPKLQITNLAEFQRLHQKSFAAAAAYFAQNGFEPVIDLEDLSMIQANFQRILVNREQNIYGIIHIIKATGKVAYVTFFAITRRKNYLLVANTYGAPLQYPQNMIVQYFPNQSIMQSHQELLRMLGERREEPRALPLKYLLPIAYNVRTVSLEMGLQQGLLHIKGKGMPGAAISTCYHHPTNVAVRACAVCHTPLCEACYTPYQDQSYCNKCLPEAARAAAPPPMLVAGGGYAGLGVRALAMLIDLIVIVLGAIAVYTGTSYGIRLLTTNTVYRSIPLMLTQLFLITFTIFYLIAPLRKYGRTIGKKILGLRVVDRHGNIPESVAAVVRFAYHLLACLFVFPVLGYLFIPFRKTKQGLHDQLAGTFVVTRHPWRKALVSWCVLFVILGSGGWYAYQNPPPQAIPWLFFFRAFLFGGRMPESRMVMPEITLKPQWQHQFPEKNGLAAYVMRGEQGLVVTATSLQALNMRTGKILWTADNLPNVEFQQLSQDPDVPLVGLQYQEDGKVALVNIDPQSGAVLWKQALALEKELAESDNERYLTVDSQTILVHGNDRVSEYDLNGKLLWTSGSLTKRFQDNLILVEAVLNKGVLIGRYSEASRIFTYFERRTGKILWEMKNSEYNPEYTYTLGDGQQVFYTNDNKAMLMDLPKQKFLWKSPQDIGQVIKYDAKQAYLYTDKAAVRQKDGSVVFSYPNSRFACVTDDFLILLRTLQNGSELLLVDKGTGNVKKSFPEKAWVNVVYLSEDKARTYLAANLKPTNPKVREISSELVMINKQTLELREIPVGKNIGALQFKVFPQEHLVFIPTSQHVGGYIIPEI